MASRKKEDMEGTIFKINLEKAFDHVDWSFVDYIIGKFGFEERWCGWTNYFLFNPCEWLPLTSFKGSSGLRQGDSFSPFLFTIEA